jgi:hypothetical protein
MVDVEAAGVGEPSEIDHHAIGDQPAHDAFREAVLTFLAEH